LCTDRRGFSNFPLVALHFGAEIFMFRAQSLYVAFVVVVDYVCVWFLVVIVFVVVVIVVVTATVVGNGSACETRAGQKK